MRIQLLVSTMNQSDYGLLDKLNVQSDLVVVNQCNSAGTAIFDYNGYEILWIDSKERGLSRSRNLALKNANADICVLCDDDEKLNQGYPNMIESAYKALPDADFIAFNINRIGWHEPEQLFRKPKLIHKFKTYGSVHNTFRRESVVSRNIRFDDRFGTGSWMYSSAEDCLFCMACHNAKLKMYTYPGILCDVNCEDSTWFNGYDEKYFFDTGAYLSVAFPKHKYLLQWYYPIRFRKLTEMSPLTIIRTINKGIRGCKSNMSYEQYCLGKETI